MREVLLALLLTMTLLQGSVLATNGDTEAVRTEAETQARNWLCLAWKTILPLAFGVVALGVLVWAFLQLKERHTGPLIMAIIGIIGVIVGYVLVDKFFNIGQMCQ